MQQRLFFLLVSSSVSAWGSRWNLPKSTHVISQQFSRGVMCDPPFHYLSEVVGASGRIGSFWLCQGDAAIPVPRGVSPGCLTTIGSPIYVATPSSAWPQIWNQTLETRRQDLVFVGNGLIHFEWQSGTIVVPHFAILTKCQINHSSVSTNPQSPPTYLYGRHASETARILQENGVATKILESFQDIQKAAAFKVLWASCMWLMCHSSDSPLTVAQVHNNKQDKLDQLVDELYPALVQLVGQADRGELDRYLRDYSFSIPDAIPSKDLAIAELHDRNGVFLSRRCNEHPQVYHQHLLQDLVGIKLWNNILQPSPPERSMQQKVHIDSIGLVSWGEQGPFKRASTKVIIIGAGIMGSGLALFLAEKRPDLKITVLDQLPRNSSSVGKTTPASWAWLNANAKNPKSYQLLNQLGIHAWKNEPRLHELVSWMGSLVRFEDSPQFVQEGGYPAEGPLSHDRIRELEPLAQWMLDGTDANNNDNEGFTYFFRDEGCVDPVEAVQTLQQAAEEKGVQFLRHANVTSVIRGPIAGRIAGVTARFEGQQISLTADVVAVAAGAGSGTTALGCNFELLHRPGAIAFTKLKQQQQGQQGQLVTTRLSRILVDPLRSSHVLQRPDESIVVGGGALEVGGTIGTVTTTTTMVSHSCSDRPPVQSLMDGAKRLLPTVLDDSVVVQTCEAVRPMPTDGLPIVGFIEDGLYALVSHSGITLGPLLSSLAASEIAEGVSCELLSSFRPSRFSKR